MTVTKVAKIFSSSYQAQAAKAGQAGKPLGDQKNYSSLTSSKCLNTLLQEQTGALVCGAPMFVLQEGLMSGLAAVRRTYLSFQSQARRH